MPERIVSMLIRLAKRLDVDCERGGFPKRLRARGPRWKLTFAAASDNQQLLQRFANTEVFMSEESRTGEKALFFALGTFIGATVALLLAPKSGEETRRLIAVKAREGKDYVSKGGRGVVDKTTGYVDRGKEILQQQRDQLSAALEAGKQAYREEKDKEKV
jgi:gas vesicle protein